MHVVVAGATGFIGRAVCGALVARGDVVTALVRDASRGAAGLPDAVRRERWPGDAAGLARVLAPADAVVNLTGEPLPARRWTPAFRQRLADSRVQPTRLIAHALAERGRRGVTLLNASAVGYYGDTGDREVDETSAPGCGFLPSLCVDWEAATAPAVAAGARVVLLRSGIVLGRGGGALQELARPFRLLIGGPLGSGAQWVSWIHLEDEVRLVLWALDNPAVSGPVNAVAPVPVRNRDLAREVGSALSRPSVLPAPAFALRLLLGEFADTLLSGQRVVPVAARRIGFTWRYPHLREALREALC
jgi:uncharacterized protein (TIGR01777 family)